MTPAISQVCTLSTSFAADLDAAAEAGVTHLEVWLTKLEQHLETTSAEATRALIGERNLSFVAASYQGNLLLTQGEMRQAAFEHFRARLDLCQQFRIPVLNVVADFAAKPSEADLGRAVVSLAQAAQWAAGFGVTLALEFRGGDAFCNNLDTALLLVAECGEANVGVCLDAFHFFKGPSKESDLAKLTNANLAHVQLCDVAGVPRELMTDSDRVFPGEGDFALKPILERLKEINYQRAVSLEVMNPMLWKSKPTQVMELGMTAMRKFC